MKVMDGKHMTRTLYTDASFGYYTTDEPVLFGKIAMWLDKEPEQGLDGFNYIEKVAVGKVPNLKQYINVFELIAIARALEKFVEKGLKADVLYVRSDSMTAVSWSKNGIPQQYMTAAHQEAINYFRRSANALKSTGTSLVISHIGRDRNFAGIMLEEELEKHRPME
jgi:hypothetical protein